MAKKYPQFPLKIDPDYLDKMKYISEAGKLLKVPFSAEYVFWK